MKKSYSDDKLVDKASKTKKSVKFFGGDDDSENDEGFRSKSPLLTKINNTIFKKFKNRPVN